MAPRITRVGRPPKAELHCDPKDPPQGAEKLYEDDSAAKVSPDHADKLRRILARLDAASSPQDMDLPGYRLHELKGQREGTWSVRVSGDWRVTFRFEGGRATDVDFEDYH